LADLVDLAVEITTPSRKQIRRESGREKPDLKIVPKTANILLNGSMVNDEPAGHTGERRSEVAKRAVSVIEKETKDFSGTLVLVTHGGTARCLLGSI
jgi:probable phosphoglycerate mutase